MRDPKTQLPQSRWQSVPANASLNGGPATLQRAVDCSPRQLAQRRKVESLLRPEVKRSKSDPLVVQRVGEEKGFQDASVAWRAAAEHTKVYVGDLDEAKKMGVLGDAECNDILANLAKKARKASTTMVGEAYEACHWRVKEKKITAPGGHSGTDVRVYNLNDAGKYEAGDGSYREIKYKMGGHSLLVEVKAKSDPTKQEKQDAKNALTNTDADIKSAMINKAGRMTMYGIETVAAGRYEKDHKLINDTLVVKEAELLKEGEAKSIRPAAGSLLLTVKRSLDSLTKFVALIGFAPGKTVDDLVKGEKKNNRSGGEKPKRGGGKRRTKASEISDNNKGEDENETSEVVVISEDEPKAKKVKGRGKGGKKRGRDDGGEGTAEDPLKDE